jgi:biotin operon repressor
MILELLEDGEWHSSEEIRQKTKLSRRDFKKALEFLIKYEFLIVDERGERVRLSDIFLKTLLHKSL